MPEYECNCCGFSTPLKSNYTNHLRTNKHIRNSNQPAPVPVVAAPEPEHEIKCRKCNKHFNFKQSMYRHIKYTCKIPDPEPVTKSGVKDLFCLLKKQKEEFNKKLDYQTKQIEKLIKKKSQIERLIGEVGENSDTF
jgi:hypothetical protein